MCGTYTLAKPISAVEETYNAKYRGPELPLRFNARPSQALPVILNSRPEEIVLARWGFEPGWGKGRDIINARQETLRERTMFKELFERQRCLVPADGFYEWSKTAKPKLPHLYTLQRGQLFSFAGLWRQHRHADGGLVHEFVIITTDANSLVAKTHDRMPVILPAGQERSWLGGVAVDPLMLEPLESAMISERILERALSGS